MSDTEGFEKHNRDQGTVAKVKEAKNRENKEEIDPQLLERVDQLAAKIFEISPQTSLECFLINSLVISIAEGGFTYIPPDDGREYSPEFCQDQQSFYDQLIEKRLFDIMVIINNRTCEEALLGPPKQQIRQK